MARSTCAAGITPTSARSARCAAWSSGCWPAPDASADVDRRARLARRPSRFVGAVSGSLQRAPARAAGTVGLPRALPGRDRARSAWRGHDSVCRDRSTGDPVKIVVGLGNPGDQYAKTRHNIGWMVLDRLADRAGWTGKGRTRDASAIAMGRFKGLDVTLVKPLTWMNDSGLAVRKVLAREHAPLADLLVVTD